MNNFVIINKGCPPSVGLPPGEISMNISSECEIFANGKLLGIISAKHHKRLVFDFIKHIVSMLSKPSEKMIERYSHEAELLTSNPYNYTDCDNYMIRIARLDYDPTTAFGAIIDTLYFIISSILLKDYLFDKDRSNVIIGSLAFAAEKCGIYDEYSWQSQHIINYLKSNEYLFDMAQ